MEKKYGIILNNTANIGDEIQSLASLQFLPRIDYEVIRDRIGHSKIDDDVLLICNGWWMHYPFSFPPQNNVKCKLVSMHFEETAFKKIINNKSKNFFLDNGPVGCRDFKTLEYFKKLDIPAYFSGCLTLTLKSEFKYPKKDYILLVDVPKELVNVIKSSTNRPIIYSNNYIPPIFSPTDKLEIAKQVLRRYQQAHLVITTRLHAAMPCLALDSNVLLIVQDEYNPRFDGLQELVNSICVSDAALELENINYDSPTANPDTYKPIRDKLISEVFNFTGHYSPYDSHAIKGYDFSNWSNKRILYLTLKYVFANRINNIKRLLKI
jgi:hypothetical protein